MRARPRSRTDAAVRGLTKLASGPGNVALTERPEPSAAPGQVVLDVVAAGICGTDLHIHDGEYPAVPPVTMGHEVSGIVAELGDGVGPAWGPARVGRASGGRVHVRGTPRDAARLDLAGALGLATSTTDDAAPGEFDVVVECSGHPAGMASALESAARGGRYVQIGLAGKPVLL